MSKDLRQGISSAFHQIRTRALRDAPVYLQHVNSAQQELNQMVSGLYTQQQVEQMMNELIGENPPESEHWRYSDEGQGKIQLRIQQRQLIPSIIKKFGGK